MSGGVSSVAAASALLLKKELRGARHHAHRKHAPRAVRGGGAHTRTRVHALPMLTRAHQRGRHVARAPRTELQKSPVEGFSAGLVDDSNIYEWEILIMGPPDTM